MDCWPVQGAPCLLLKDSWDWLQPLRDRQKDKQYGQLINLAEVADYNQLELVFG